MPPYESDVPHAVYSPSGLFRGEIVSTDVTVTALLPAVPLRGKNFFEARTEDGILLKVFSPFGSRPSVGDTLRVSGELESGRWSGYFKAHNASKIETASNVHQNNQRLRLTAYSPLAPRSLSAAGEFSHCGATPAE